MHYVIVPGINGSGAEHWQSRWQDAWGPSATRIAPASWDCPDLDDWCLALDRATHRQDPSDLVLVAHSLGCLTAAFWLRENRPNIRGAFLVAPPDVTRPGFPVEAASYVRPDAGPIRIPGVLLSSDDDHYCTSERSRQLADAWGVPHLGIGSAGHVNTASGFGAWPAGRMLLTAFTAGLGLAE